MKKQRSVLSLPKKSALNDKQTDKSLSKQLSSTQKNKKTSRSKKEQKTTALHPNNPHSGRYSLDRLCSALPELTQHIKLNPRGEKTIDFSEAEAVKLLNKALLKDTYKIEFWDIPKDYLCPPIPGRADYIHYLADLLNQSHNNQPATGRKIQGLDIGTGANLIYPLLATKSYGWRMTGSDIDPISLQSSKMIIQANQLNKCIKVIKQSSPAHIFEGVIKPAQKFHFTMCNPPFHGSAEEAQAGTRRKLNNLTKKSSQPNTTNQAPALNFGGQSNELWCEGGELTFIKQMIRESVSFKDQCLWFTTLVSKKDNLPAIFRTLKKQKVTHYKEINMAQGQKASRIIAWTFQEQAQHPEWFVDR